MDPKAFFREVSDLLTPLVEGTDSAHLANERLRRVNLLKGKNVLRRFFETCVPAQGDAKVPSPNKAVGDVDPFGPRAEAPRPMTSTG